MFYGLPPTKSLRKTGELSVDESVSNLEIEGLFENETSKNQQILPAAVTHPKSCFLCVCGWWPVIRPRIIETWWQNVSLRQETNERRSTFMN